MKNPNVKLILAECLEDRSGNEQNTSVYLNGNTEDNEICLSIVFPSAGIFRSRPATISAVNAAVNAIWETAYHRLFGAEACPYMPVIVSRNEEETGL